MHETHVELLDLSSDIGQSRYATLADDRAVVITKITDSLDSKTATGIRVVDYTSGHAQEYTRPIC